MTAPKISKENIAFVASLTALCFSNSIWSIQNKLIQSLCFALTVIFATIVFVRIHEKKGKRKHS